VAVAAATGLVACNSILGMDAPSLATPCDGGCADGGLGDEDGATDSPVTPKDAAPDVELPDGSIRCGGGSYPTSWCVPGVQQCCQTGGAAAPAFACVTTGTCTGYAIECANYDDCAGMDICCRFMAHQVCDVPANCPNGEIVWPRSRRTSAARSEPGAPRAARRRAEGRGRSSSLEGQEGAPGALAITC